MNEQFETVRQAAERLRWWLPQIGKHAERSPHHIVDAILAALAKIEAEHARVTRRDTAADFLSGYFGTRCKDYEPECFVCAAWKFYDELRSAPEQKEPAQPPLATLAEVRRVLGPFAKEAASWGARPDSYAPLSSIEHTVGDFRAAAALLARIPEAE